MLLFFILVLAGVSASVSLSTALTERLVPKSMQWARLVSFLVILFSGLALSVTASAYAVSAYTEYAHDIDVPSLLIGAVLLPAARYLGRLLSRLEDFLIGSTRDA